MVRHVSNEFCRQGKYVNHDDGCIVFDDDHFNLTLTSQLFHTQHGAYSHSGTPAGQLNRACIVDLNNTIKDQ